MKNYYKHEPRRRYASGRNGNGHYRPNANGRGSNRPSRKSDFKIVEAIRAMQSEAPVKTNEETYVPQNSFNDFPISPALKANILDKKYTDPTPIQDQSIPVILDGKDLIGIANTGTGKTASFLIPLIEIVSKDKSRKVLIVTPTRELAVQISDELWALTYGLSINWALCIGGVNSHRQKTDLRKNPNFVIGTPGRIKDFYNQRALELSQFNVVVLDEADRMVDIGFITDIKFFISKLPQKRQSLFFSATITPKVNDILKSFVNDPVTISVKKSDKIKNIKHDIVSVNGQGKTQALHDLLITDGFDKVLIFGRTKFGVQRLTNELIDRGFRAGVIHGNKTQSQRQRVLDDFKSNQIKVLLATDVASRGLDIPNVSHVINFDLPASYEDYIHRVGRTGRADKTGVALTFIQN